MKNPKDKDTTLEEEMDVFDEFESGEDLPESRQDDELGLDFEDEEHEEGDEHVDFKITDTSIKLDEQDVGVDRQSEIDEDVYEEKVSAAQNLSDQLLNLSPDVPVNLVAVIGKTTSNIGEVMKYQIGNVIDLGKPPSETVDLVANGRMIARGELVEIDGKLGVKILKLVK